MHLSWISYTEIKPNYSWAPGMYVRQWIVTHIVVYLTVVDTIGNAPYNDEIPVAEQSSSEKKEEPSENNSKQRTLFG